MTKLITTLTVGLLSAAACRESSDTTPDYPAAKPAESTTTTTTTVTTDPEFARTRDEFVATSKVRLRQLGDEIEKLSMRTDQEAKEAAARLRVKRDQLSARVERAENYTKANWKQFESDVSRAFDDLERDIKGR